MSRVTCCVLRELLLAPCRLVASSPRRLLPVDQPDAADEDGRADEQPQQRHPPAIRPDHPPDLASARGEQQGSKGERHGHKAHSDQFQRRHARDDVLDGDERVAPDEGSDEEQGCPEGGSAGRLLEKVGAKGMRCGGARVPGEHANFVLAEGKTSASDILDLMRTLQERVLDETGTLLEPEVMFAGFEEGDPVLPRGARVVREIT